MSQRAHVPSSFFGISERCVFPPQATVIDTVAQLENTGVTDPDKCRTKFAP